MSNSSETLVVKSPRFTKFFVAPAFVGLFAVAALLVTRAGIEENSLTHIVLGISSGAYALYLLPGLKKLLFGHTIISINSQGIDHIKNGHVNWADVTNIEKKWVWHPPLIVPHLYMVLTLKNSKIIKLPISWETVSSKKIYNFSLQAWKNS